MVVLALPVGWNTGTGASGLDEYGMRGFMVDFME
jgi:hypothetical protein